jgi:hypothetical protein
VVTKSLGNRGASRVGCLFTLLIVAALAYYGFGIGGTFVTHARVKDAMRQEARSAVLVDDNTMRRRLRAIAEGLDLPESALDFQIRRTVRPREVVISTHWIVIWEVPFYTREHSFEPEVRFPI